MHSCSLCCLLGRLAFICGQDRLVNRTMSNSSACSTAGKKQRHALLIMCHHRTMVVNLDFFQACTEALSRDVVSYESKEYSPRGWRRDFVFVIDRDIPSIKIQFSVCHMSDHSDTDTSDNKYFAWCLTGTTQVHGLSNDWMAFGKCHIFRKTSAEFHVMRVQPFRM